MAGRRGIEIAGRVLLTRATCGYFLTVTLKLDVLSQVGLCYTVIQPAYFCWEAVHADLVGAHRSLRSARCYRTHRDGSEESDADSAWTADAHLDRRDDACER